MPRGRGVSRAAYGVSGPVAVQVASPTTKRPCFRYAALSSDPGVPAVAAPPETPTLVDVTASHHSGFDRIVFEFDGGLPARHRVQYVDRLVADGSGLPVRVAGRATLRVVLSPSLAHDDGGPRVPRRRAFALPNVMTIVRAGDFEAVTTYGIGLAKRHLSRSPRSRTRAA